MLEVENRYMEKPRTGDAAGPLRFHGGTSDGREVPSPVVT